jgi:thiol-disulfide isomerase/thioredoxin
MAAPASGRNALPDAQLECIGEIGSTQTVALRRLGGKPTVVNLWASWCDPCKTELPEFQSVYAAAGGRVRFLGVNTKDSSEGARATIAQTGVKFANLADPSHQLRDSLGSNLMPATLFVDAQGRVVYTQLGPLKAKDLREKIAEHLRVQL